MAQDSVHYCRDFDEWLTSIAGAPRRRSIGLICADVGARNLRLVAARRPAHGRRELFVVKAGAWEDLRTLADMIRSVPDRLQQSRKARWVVDLPGAVEWDHGRRDHYARLTNLPGSPPIYRKQLERLARGPLRIVNDGFAVGAALIPLAQSGRLEGTFVGADDQRPPAAPNQPIGYLCPGSGVATGLIIPEPTAPRRSRWAIRPMEIQHFPYPVLAGNRRDRDWLKWVERHEEPPIRLEYPACGLGVPDVYEWAFRRHARRLRREGRTRALQGLQKTRAAIAEAADPAAEVFQRAGRRRPDRAAAEAADFSLLALARIAANLALQLPKGGVYLVGPNIVANRDTLLRSRFWHEYVHCANLQEDLLESIPVALLDSDDPFYVTYLQLAGGLWLAENRFELLNLRPDRRAATE